jgi:ParB/RepB/Spo0J family partition protein
MVMKGQDMDSISPTGEVHAAAAIFPMLPEDELADLAADIKANGLIHPIVIDADGALVDGRNRIAACQIAGVEPQFTSLNGHDPVAYILSANINRRNLTKSQRAMAVAKLLETNNSRQQDAADQAGVNRTRVAQANTVLKYAPELAEAVLAGTQPLDAAYEQAKQRKEEQSSRTDLQERLERALTELRVNAPDLADLVDEERMPLRDALTLWKQRKKEEDDSRKFTSTKFVDTIIMLNAVMMLVPERVVRDWYPGSNPRAQGDAYYAQLFSGEGLRELCARLTQIADMLDEEGVILT